MLLLTFFNQERFRQSILFWVLGILPTARLSLGELVRFQIDYSFRFNILFAIVSGILLYLHWQRRQQGNQGQVKATE